MGGNDFGRAGPYALHVRRVRTSRGLGILPRRSPQKPAAGAAPEKSSFSRYFTAIPVPAVLPGGLLVLLLVRVGGAYCGIILRSYNAYISITVVCLLSWVLL